MAKQPKKVTREMKELLSANGYDPKRCKFIEEYENAYRFVDIEGDPEYDAFWVPKKKPVKKTLVYRS